MGRDPIGFEGSPFCFYEFLGGNTMDALDPNGLMRGTSWPPAALCCNGKQYDPIKKCCDGGEIKEKRSCLECCSEFARINRPQVSGTLICCDASWCGCVFPRNIDEWHGGIGSELGMKLIVSCAHDHERTHASQPHHQPCGCGEISQGYHKKGYESRNECEAYASQHLCLHRNRRACRGDQECLNAINKEIDRVRDMGNYYGCWFPWWS